MRMIFGLVLIVGVGLAGFAVYMAKNYIEQYQTALAEERKQRAPSIEVADIYVAKRKLEYGQRLGKDDVRLISFPKNSMPEGAFAEAGTLFPEGDDKQRTILRTMEKNEPVLAVKLTEPGQEGGISSQLSRGMRAFALKVDISSGVSGFLRPGDRVDVFWTGSVGGEQMRTEGDSTGEVTKLIQTGVRLIAVDQVADSDTSGAIIARTVTVAASPQQVAALAQAQATGRLSLSLVGSQDDTVAEVLEVDQRRLLGLTREMAAPQEPKEEECFVRTRRGADVIKTPIPCTN